MYGGPGGAFEWMILDNAETSYQSLGLDRGLRDALPQEIDALSETRIAMVFGIPGSILGLRIGYESSSYANKRQDWQVLWDLKMVPMLSDFDDVLNLQLVPDFNGVDEVLFDLSDIRALQEDVDKVQQRVRDNVKAGLMAWEEGMEAIGLDPTAVAGKTYFVPMSVNPTPGELVPQVELPGAPEGDRGDKEKKPDEKPDVIAEVRHFCTKAGPKGALVAKDIEGDPELQCPKCRALFRPSDPPPRTVIVKDVERDDEHRILRVVEHEEVAT